MTKGFGMIIKSRFTKYVTCISSELTIYDGESGKAVAYISNDKSILCGFSASTTDTSLFKSMAMAAHAISYIAPRELHVCDISSITREMQWGELKGEYGNGAGSVLQDREVGKRKMELIFNHIGRLEKLTCTTPVYADILKEIISLKNDITRLTQK